jgi:hypothetical protein
VVSEASDWAMVIPLPSRLVVTARKAANPLSRGTSAVARQCSMNAKKIAAVLIAAGDAILPIFISDYCHKIACLRLFFKWKWPCFETLPA